MEHFKSTIATTAIAAFGLVAAAHILHPGNFERTTYPSRPVATVASQHDAWVNPPASLAVAEAKPAASAPEAATVQPLPVAWTSVTAPKPVAEAVPAREHRRRISAAHRRKMAQRQARLRQASLERPVPAAAPAPAPKPQSDRIDPIGDLIRGLGLGSDS